MLEPRLVASTFSWAWHAMLVGVQQGDPLRHQVDRSWWLAGLLGRPMEVYTPLLGPPPPTCSSTLRIYATLS